MTDSKLNYYKLAPWKKTMTNPDSILESIDIKLPTKVHSKSYGFSRSYVQMWDLDHKGGWVPKNWCFRTVVLEKTLESPLDCKEIQPVNPKGNQSWIFIGRSDAEAPILLPPDVNSVLIRKDWSWKRLRIEEKGMPENEMVGWHHQVNGHEFEQTPRVDEDREAWHAAVHGATKSRTRLCDWTTTTKLN